MVNIMNDNLIDNDSILGCLPLNIDPSHAMFYDGIRQSLLAASLANKRLTSTISSITETQENIVDLDVVTAAYIDAWGFIDAIDRFRQLWNKAPFVSAEEKQAADMDNKLSNLRSARNVADHVAVRTEQIISKQGSIAGHLSWCNYEFSNPKEYKYYFMTIGVYGTSKGTMQTLAPDSFDTEGIKEVRLESLGYVVVFDHIVNYVRECVSSLESQLSDSMKVKNINKVEVGWRDRMAVVNMIEKESGVNIFDYKRVGDKLIK